MNARLKSETWNAGVKEHMEMPSAAIAAPGIVHIPKYTSVAETTSIQDESVSTIQHRGM